MPLSKAEKAQKAKEKKEKKQLELQVKQSHEKCTEGKAFLEPEGRGAQPLYPKAIVCFDAAIELYPENTTAFILRGNAYRDQKQYAQAEEDYTKAISLDPQSVPALDGRALCYERLGQWDRAISDYTTAIEVNPENDHAYNMRASARLQKRAPGLKLKNAEFSMIVDDFLVCVRLNENNYFAWVNLGRVYCDQQMYTKSIEAYTHALRIKDDYTYAFFRRACTSLILVESHIKADEEEKKLKAAVAGKIPGKAAENPYNTPEEAIAAEEAIAKSAEEIRKLLRDAISDFNRVINPEEPAKEESAIIHRGTCYFLLKEYRKASDDFNTALKGVEAVMALPVEERPPGNHSLTKQVLGSKIQAVRNAVEVSMNSSVKK